jgi:hypothetical protein
MNQNCDFVTFCYRGDADKLHAPGQLKIQVESNNFHFTNVFVVYQFCGSLKYPEFDASFNVKKLDILESDVYSLLMHFGLNKKQYHSSTDKKHYWEFHVINHLRGIQNVTSEYVVFADADCWMNPHEGSWVKEGIEILEENPEVFIVSPNDGEEARLTQRMSQQMFLTRSRDFRRANFNQPNWDGNVHIKGGPMPEYWAMLEGRMELHCRNVGKYRYVLGPEFRYWHYQW